ncbi:4a-hydroxytetrahydrobiopterin dehydratase [Embleya sp. NPDC127516]|uniref:4a-hydroxytetrahydrobiopterin dehydratase n=1 Tax=Embleya sp. NPDC127516 TaxID=3363990 RepID=UPI0038275F8B
MFLRISPRATKRVSVIHARGHHWDAALGYKTVHISISSSDLGGCVAEHDLELARRIEAAAPAHGAVPID